MEKLSDGKELSLILVGNKSKFQEITNFSSLTSHFLLRTLPREGVESWRVSGADDLKNAPTVDFILNLSPVGRIKIIKNWKTFRKKGVIVLWNTLPFNKPFWKGKDGYCFAVGPQKNNMMPSTWGDHILNAGGNLYYLYPFAPKTYVKPDVKLGKIVIDNERNKRPDLTDRFLFYEVLGELRKEYDLDVWQESVIDRRVPDFIKPIAKGRYVNTSITPHRAILPWDEYRKHINEAMIFMPSLPESYGIDKFHSVASHGQVIVRNSFQRRAYTKEFGFLTYNNKKQLKDAIRNAFRIYEHSQHKLRRRAEKIWSYRKLTDEIIGCLKGLKKNG